METVDHLSSVSRIVEPERTDNTSLQDVFSSQNNALPTQTPIAQNTVEVPSKFANSSREDMIHNYVELEKSMGKQGAELGELRKLTDQLVLNQTSPQNNQPQQEEIDWEDPDKATSSIVRRETNDLRNTLAQMEVQNMQHTLQQEFPDWKQIIEEPEFGEWVRSSPVRSELYYKADNADLVSARELFGIYKERKDLLARNNATEAAEVQQNRQEQFQNAAVTTGHAAPTADGNQGKPVYRRADIVRLKIENPSQAAAMQQEIDAAYAEGRVK